MNITYSLCITLFSEGLDGEAHTCLGLLWHFGSK